MNNLRVLNTIAIEADGLNKFYHIDYINQKIYSAEGQEEVHDPKLVDFVFRKLESQPIDIPELAAIDKIIEEVQQIRNNYQGYKHENSEEEEEEEIDE
jgi:hypothetical protein